MNFLYKILKYYNLKKVRPVYLPCHKFPRLKIDYTIIPTSAHYIIATSFPPSPIAQVIYFVYFFMQRTTWLFYVGEQRQHTTDCDKHARAKNYNYFVCKIFKILLYYSKVLSRAVFKDTPSITSKVLYGESI